MKITLYGNRLAVDRRGERFKNESAWWYALKKILNAQGHDVIKKLMYKDGHLVDDNQYYLRDRKWLYCFCDEQYAVRLVHEHDVVTLGMVRWEES